MSPTNMLELQQLVLENVYENKLVFEKELRKSFKWLEKDDLIKLYYWTIGKFDEQCRKIINGMYSGFDFQQSNPLNSYAKGII